jgi:hypothetical protein
VGSVGEVWLEKAELVVTGGAVRPAGVPAAAGAADAGGGGFVEDAAGAAEAVTPPAVPTSRKTMREAIGPTSVRGFG